MLNSRCKEVKAAIQKEIEDTFEVRLDGYDNVPERLQDKARFYVETLREELSYTVDPYVDGKQNPYFKSDEGRIIYDLNSGTWECGTYERWLQVKEWLHQTEDEAGIYTYEAGDERWQQLIAREVMALTRMK